MKKKILGVLILVSMVGGLFCGGSVVAVPPGGGAGAPSGASTDTATGGSGSSSKTAACTSILPDKWCDDKNAALNIVKLILYVLTAGVGVLGMAGIIAAGVQYATARDNDQQVVAAKERIRNIVIGLFLWIFLFAMLNLFLIGPVS